MKKNTALAQVPLRETLDFKIFHELMLQRGRSRWSPQMWASLVIQILRDTGTMMATSEGRETYKICVDILRKTRSENIFKDWTETMIPNQRPHRDEALIKEIKRQHEKHWAEIMGENK